VLILKYDDLITYCDHIQGDFQW